MTHEQLNLPTTPDQPAFDAQAIADYINSHSPEDPYSSQERLTRQIADRKTATYTPDTLPEHLKPTMEAAEVHFAQPAPGKRTGTATVEVELPHQDATPEPPEMYFDPTTGKEHVIDQALTQERTAALRARVEARAIAGVTAEPRGDTAAVGHGKTLGYLGIKGLYPY